jgi:putative tricarboxylic transport membrane protein
VASERPSATDMTWAVISQAFGLVFDPYVLWVILASALFGLFVGCIPGLTATMATALLVPITFFMPPVPAVAAIVACTAMAIFAGDIPGALLRIPGTPASAAYTDEAYAMTKKGQAEVALGAGLIFSAIGGLFGTAVLIWMAPALAEVALKFSSFEYFWLVVLGLAGAVFIGSQSTLKAVISLLLGLLVACVGLDNPGAHPRFTFGNTELTGGVSLIPMMVGMFAVSEILRYVTSTLPPPQFVAQRIGNVFRGMWQLTVRYRWPIVRGSALGTVIGIQPGSGADMASWMSYAMSKRFSKEPEKFGTGHVEGIIESGAANNSSLAGAWIPAIVFGIPGDSITAIAIGVLYLKNMNPGPTIFINNPENIYAIFLVFILANLIMVPLGWMAIKAAKNVLRAPRNLLMPVILLFCVVGSFAINNTPFGVLLILVFGLAAFVLEDNGFPSAPAILGVVLGGMLEENFITSMIKSDGDPFVFFTRPIAGGLAAATLVILGWPLLARLWRRARSRQATA